MRISSGFCRGEGAFWIYLTLSADSNKKMLLWYGPRIASEKIASSIAPFFSSRQEQELIISWEKEEFFQDL
jgi:hypothetical protein